MDLAVRTTSNPSIVRGSSSAITSGWNSTESNTLTTQGWVRYQLKTPYRDGTTHVVLEPLDFIARLAALIPKPRVNLTRYGVFAPNSAQCSEVTPAQRGRRAGTQPTEEPKTDAERRAAMRPKRSASSVCSRSTSRPARRAVGR
jgi:hypothetical protein